MPNPVERRHLLEVVQRFAQDIITLSRMTGAGGLVKETCRRLETLRRVGFRQVLLARMWNLVNGDERIAQSLTLGNGDLVVDVGAYQGEFVAQMRACDAQVIAVEPIPEFAEALKAKFSLDPRVSVLALAAGRANGTASIAIDGDSSSIWTDSPRTVEVPVRDISLILGGEQVALMKINAEGAEFDVLDRVLETEQIAQIERILVQFHRFVPGAVVNRRRIRKSLGRTHQCVWNVPWVWEFWTRKG